MTPHRQGFKHVMSLMLPPDRFLSRGEVELRTPSITGRSVTQVSLTFDDGPHPEWTLPALDALDEQGWKGTFFVIGRHAEAHPRIVREIVARGHEIGNHTYLHSDPDTTDVHMFMKDVRRTKCLLEEITGQSVDLMRPPKGRLDIRKARALWRDGQTVALWSVDPKDFQVKSDAEAIDWAQQYAPGDGDIVLLHDRLPFAARIVRTLAELHGDRLQSLPTSHWINGAPVRGMKRWLRAAGGLFCS